MQMYKAWTLVHQLFINRRINRSMSALQLLKLRIWQVSDYSSSLRKNKHGTTIISEWHSNGLFTWAWEEAQKTCGWPFHLFFCSFHSPTIFPPIYIYIQENSHNIRTISNKVEDTRCYTNISFVYRTIDTEKLLL